MLGVKPSDIRKLVAAGYLTPGQPRPGGTRLYWPEYEVARVRRESTHRRRLGAVSVAAQSGTSTQYEV
jgi:hypothetical protein